MLQHRAAGYPIGPEKKSAIAALDRATELLGGRDTGVAGGNGDTLVSLVAVAGLVLRKAERHERIAIDVLREFARAVHDLRLAELASLVLSAQSERMRLTFAVRLAEAVWAVSHGGEMAAWTESLVEGAGQCSGEGRDR